ncbi:hypothetical protein ScPMuIL_018203, partial [Solemya velum]
MDTVNDVDEIWLSLGTFGLYQRFQFLLCMVDIIPWAFVTMGFVFVAYKPPFSCNVDHISFGITNGSTNDGGDLVYGLCSVAIHNSSTNQTHMPITNCQHGINYSVPEDRTIVTEFDLVCDRGSMKDLTQTLLMLGLGVGALLFTPMSDKFGRKPLNVSVHIVSFILSIGISFSPNYIVYAILRFLIGTTLSGFGLTASILSLELFPRQNRGRFYSCGLFFWTTGCLLVVPISYLCKNISWRYLQLALTLVSTYSLIKYWLIDESLRWLIANGKICQAKQIIERAARLNKTTPQKALAILDKITAENTLSVTANGTTICQISTTQVPEKNEVGNGTIVHEEKTAPMRTSISISDAAKNKHVIKVTLISWFMWMTNSLTYYGVFLMSTQLDGNRFLNYTLSSIIEYPAFFLQINLINRIGRQKTSILFHSIAGVSLITAAILLATSDTTETIFASTALSLVGKFGITGSFSTIYLYTPELYPTNLRNAGIGVSSTAGRVGGMIAPFAGFLYEKVIWAPGTVFGLMCLTVSFLTLFLPETHGRELPQTLVELNTWYERKPPKQKKKISNVEI